MVKLAVFSLYFCLFVTSDAVADPQQAIRSYIQSAEEIFLVNVTAINGQEITFSVLKKFKGPDAKTFKLLDVESPPISKEDSGFPLNSEWLLVSTGSNQNTVRWARGGGTGWVAAWIQICDGRYYYVDGAFLSGELGDSTPLPLKQVSELASSGPQKH